MQCLIAESTIKFITPEKPTPFIPRERGGNRTRQKCANNYGFHYEKDRYCWT